ncbi:hypothetical protein Clacol_009313 [Clathrus columnatus]|uniref:Uncharacterized protein n=1 Tax=Clathrus columnatus TaxID=1419009 RepID=A0AAV5AQQ1_9AGAM|nr:hypothetical protein Clacol_009313 [Clathrus columnatus]
MGTAQVISPDDTNYWKQYWELFDSVEEVNTLITPQHISPWNSQTYPNDVRSVLNCARVIARVLPLIWEEDVDCRWLWEEMDVSAVSPTTGNNVPPTILDNDGQPQFVIDDEEDEDSEVRPSHSPPVPASSKKAHESSNTTKSKPKPKSLMMRFLDALIDSLFHVGFTLPLDAAESATNRIGASSVAAPTSIHVTNRSTLLLTLLTALSHPLYVVPNSYRHHTIDPVISYLCSYPRKTHLALVCSLINTALTPPAAHLLGQVTREEDLYAQRAAQVVLALLCEPQLQVGLEEGETAVKSNTYQRAVAKLHRQQDFDYLIEGIKNTLDNESARKGLVNGVAKAVPVGRRASGPGVLEVWLLLWRAIDLNKKFMAHLLSSSHLLAICSHLFATLMTHKDSPTHFALLRTLAYLLQTLSSHRPFAIALGLPLPNSVAPRGSDALVGSIYAIIAGTKGQHQGLYQPLLVTLGNVGPYIKQLSVQSSNKIISLFQAFASPGFLLGDEGNPRCLFWIIVRKYQLYPITENPNLVYAILRAHERFTALSTFSLSSGLAEIALVKAKREEYLLRTQGGTPTPGLGQIPATGDRKLSHERQNSSSVVRSSEETDSTSVEKDRLRDREIILNNVTNTPVNPSGNNTILTDKPATESRDDLETPLTTTPTFQSPPVLSEKARGKLPVRSVSTLSMDPPGVSMGVSADNAILGYHYDGNAGSGGLGPNSFVATDEWVQSWTKGLPIDSILVAVAELLPKLQSHIQPNSSETRNNPIVTTAVATSLLSSSTLVGILPPPPPIISRRFVWTDRSEVWRASLLWGEIYVSSGPSQGPWGGTQIRLFGIKQAPLTRRDQAIASVTTAMGNMWSAATRSAPSVPSSPARRNSGRE